MPNHVILEHAVGGIIATVQPVGQQQTQKVLFANPAAVQVAILGLLGADEPAAAAPAPEPVLAKPEGKKK